MRDTPIIPEARLQIPYGQNIETHHFPDIYDLILLSSHLEFQPDMGHTEAQVRRSGTGGVPISIPRHGPGSGLVCCLSQAGTRWTHSTAPGSEWAAQVRQTQSRMSFGLRACHVCAHQAIKDAARGL
jgi:hypothetical protein